MCVVPEVRIVTEPPVEIEETRRINREAWGGGGGGGFVTEVHKGENSQSIEYQRRASNKVKLDENGAPLVEKITTRMNGQESVIDLSGSTQDDGLKDLAKRIQVVQKGDNIGNVMIASDDGKHVSTMHSDFTNTTHEIIDVAGKISFTIGERHQIRRLNHRIQIYGRIKTQLDPHK